MSVMGELETALRRELGKVVVGGDATVRALTLALVARGHVLLQGAPGLGKTLLAKTFAAAIGGDFQRIQGTADLMPADIIGVHVYDESTRRFAFRPGPLFAQVVLVDEINRAGPKTQSALLEAMEERQVSAERELFRLPDEFLVVATQNPREFEGTYPLPESQLDRFMLRVDVDYPSRELEAEVLRRYGASFEGVGAPPASITPVDRGLLQAAREAAAGLHVSAALIGYVLDLAAASREDPRVSLGLSTRGVLALLRAARVMAGLRGAEFVTPDDVKDVAPWTIPHRLMLAPEAALEGATDLAVVRGLLERTPVPR
ncbi:MAG: MoxR family ATPase [Sinobacteraceae bacterium]|nr:MoxR family ATPase [Nevskiaceae bacterium]